MRSFFHMNHIFHMSHVLSLISLIGISRITCFLKVRSFWIIVS